MKIFIHLLQSRLLGAILIISGTTIGAALLALPVVTGRAGFMLSSFGIILCWAYLLYAAFCLLEVNLSLPSNLNIISMAEHSLGKWGKYATWVFYLFLLYALETAYISGMSGLIATSVQLIFGITLSTTACAGILLLFFVLLLRYGIKHMDYFNKCCMSILAVTYFLLVSYGMPFVEKANLTTVDVAYFLPAIPVIVTSFGFHIVIPSLVQYLEKDVRQLKIAIWVGTLIPLFVYLLWQYVIIGLVPSEGNWSIQMALENGIGGAELLAGLGNSSLIAWAIQLFTGLVIITSLVGVTISLSDFLRDGLHIQKNVRVSWVVFLLTFVPPFYFVLSFQDVFFGALRMAGVYGVVTLLALLPGLMVWSTRYRWHIQGPYQVFGGKKILFIFLLISCVIIFTETLLKIGIIGQ